MEALSVCAMIVGPALIALFALVFAVRLTSPARRDQASSGRLVGAYVLLLVAFGIGMCYAAMFTATARRGTLTTTVVGAVGLVVLVGLTGAWQMRILRLPRLDQRVREAFEVSLPPDRRRWAIAAIWGVAVLAAMALAAAFFA